MAIATVGLLACAGCGSAFYSWQAGDAQQRLAEAREVGAEELAPYEYYSAVAHLEKAESEAADADFGDALKLAEQSEEFSNRAIALSRAARRGARP
jgi:hypothetical protein